MHLNSKEKDNCAYKEARFISLNCAKSRKCVNNKKDVDIHYDKLYNYAQLI
jgi:hypothetical protein